MFPKKGNNVRTKGGPKYAEVISAALRAELGNSHQAVKTLGRWTGASHRAVKNWLAGRTGPNGQHLVLIMGKSDAVLYALLRSAGRENSIAATKVVEAIRFLTKTAEELGSIMDKR